AVGSRYSLAVGQGDGSHPSQRVVGITSRVRGRSASREGIAPASDTPHVVIICVDLASIGIHLMDNSAPAIKIGSLSHGLLCTAVIVSLAAAHAHRAVV